MLKAKYMQMFSEREGRPNTIFFTGYSDGGAQEHIENRLVEIIGPFDPTGYIEYLRQSPAMVMIPKMKLKALTMTMTDTHGIGCFVNWVVNLLPKLDIKHTSKYGR